MKTILCFLFLIPLGLLLSSCGTTVPAEATQLPESLKGYELYSWQESNQWVFSLLVGTNREKTLDEIKSTGAILPDVDALISMLEKVPSGEYVTWASRDTFSLPPDNIVKQVQQICEEKGLILNLAN